MTPIEESMKEPIEVRTHGSRPARACRSRARLSALLIAMIGLGSLSVSASASAPGADAGDPGGKSISGWVEKVVMLPAQIRVSAKLDTGARTSSIHAERIVLFDKDGDRWARFELVLEDEHDEVHRIPTEAPIDRRVRIKQHDEAPDARPVVELDFCMAGRRRRAQFSLVDRSAFNYPVLLGRRFMAGELLVDPDQTFLTRPDCAPASGRGAE